LYNSSKDGNASSKISAISGFWVAAPPVCPMAGGFKIWVGRLTTLSVPAML
jgi:hypothetical protein